MTCLDDLQNHVTAQDVDNLPKHVNDTLKAAQKSKLRALIGRQPPAASRGSGAAGTGPARHIYAFFAKHVDDSINVHGEAQRVMEDLQSSRCWETLELNCYTLATF